MVDLLLVRRLPPRLANVGKRLVRSPKVYVRDSGLVHALLGLADKEAVLGHPVAGASWEGLVIENLIAVAGSGREASFYRTSGGAEIDLVLTWPDGREWAIEVKRSLAPEARAGDALRPRRTSSPSAASSSIPGASAIALGAGRRGDRAGRSPRGAQTRDRENKSLQRDHRRRVADVRQRLLDLGQGRRTISISSSSSRSPLAGERPVASKIVTFSVRKPGLG